MKGHNGLLHTDKHTHTNIHILSVGENMGMEALTMKGQFIKFQKYYLSYFYLFCYYFFFFFCPLFKMGAIHHVGISDISTVLQINGSLTAPAADMDTRLSPWQLQKRNRNTNWASLSDWKGKRIDHWQSWHKSISDSWKPLFYCYPWFPQVPLLSIRQYRHAWNSHSVWLSLQEFGLRCFRGHFDKGRRIEEKACQWLCCLLIANVVRA